MDAILKAALVGTARHPGVPLDPDHAPDALLAPLPAADPEHLLLLRAGAGSLYAQCGRVARADVPALDPAPTAGTPHLARRWVGVLQQTFASDQRELLLEFLRALQETGVDLPHELLPTALGQTDPDVRSALLPVLGERGCWLSRLNPPWAWAADDADARAAPDRVALRRAWEEGNHGQRCLALTALRRAAPDEAREWLEEVLPQEKADRRAGLLEQLRVGLNPADEPLLERLLDDRSEQVRLQAAQLLRRLPDSAFAARMRARGEAMLHPDTKAGAFKLMCLPPEELGKDWIRDGIPAKTPHGRGKRSFWAEMVLSSVPPGHWVGHFRKPPGELIAAVQGDPFADDVLMSWTRAVCGFGGQTPEDVAWAEALRPVWGARLRAGKARHAQEDLNLLAALIRVLPAPRAEAAVEYFLRDDPRNSHFLDSLLAALPRPWSPEFARAYLNKARTVVKTAVIDQAYEWVRTLEPAARAIPRVSFAAALAPWDVERLGEKSWTASAIARQVDQFLDLVRVRQSFYEELQT